MKNNLFSLNGLKASKKKTSSKLISATQRDTTQSSMDTMQSKQATCPQTTCEELIHAVASI